MFQSHFRLYAASVGVFVFIIRFVISFVNPLDSLHPEYNNHRSTIAPEWDFMKTLGLDIGTTSISCVEFDEKAAEGAATSRVDCPF